MRGNEGSKIRGSGRKANGEMSEFMHPDKERSKDKTNSKEKDRVNQSKRKVKSSKTCPSKKLRTSTSLEGTQCTCKNTDDR